MKKAAVKGFRCIFQNLRFVPTVILLTAIIGITIYVAGAVYAEASDEITLSSSTAAEAKPTIEQPDEWQTVQMRVTAYCPCPKCCGKYSGGPTACGYKIRPGDVFVAADKKYSFGTEMLIAGYNNGEPVKVLDRGGAIQGDRLDVFFGSHEEALNWGVKYLDVKVRRGPQT